MWLLYFPISSILYADIVGFTQLASDCSPGELVHMLNELFGKFDQIAKVNISILSSVYHAIGRAAQQRPDFVYLSEAER